MTKRERKEKREKKEKKEQDGGKKEEEREEEDKERKEEEERKEEDKERDDKYMGGAGAEEAARAAYGEMGKQHAEFGRGNAIEMRIQGGKSKKSWMSIPTSFLSSNKMYKKRTNKTKKNKGKKSRRTYRSK